MHDPHKEIPPQSLARYADAIERPRITIVARKLAHARAVIQALGWSVSAWAPANPWQPRPWPDRGNTAIPRVIVHEELVVGRCADGADFVLTVESRGRGQPLWIEITGSEHEPRSGLMRRLRAGFVGPLRC